MLEFLTENWTWLVELFVGVLSVILLVFRKRYRVYSRSIEEYILNRLPEAISAAEHVIPSHGPKMDFVVNLVSDFLKEEFPDVKVSRYFSFIRSSAERILACPQKKEVSNEI